MSVDTPPAALAVPTVRLRDLGERSIVKTVLGPRYATVQGFGDDCARLGRGMVATTDSCPTPLLEQLGETDPYAAGWLLVTINLSDLAAAGAVPSGLVVNYTLPADTPLNWLERMVQGVNDCAAFHRTTVVGGDIQDGPRHLTATAIGRTPLRSMYQRRLHDSRLGRRGAEAGEVLLLIGNPGYLWAAALMHRGHADALPSAARERVFDRARRPVAQLTAGRLLAERALSRAAMDVSDGLYASVKQLAGANRLGALMEPEIELDDDLKDICRLAGVSSFQLGQNWGDWCLLVAVCEKDEEKVLRLLARQELSARRVGVLTSDAGSLQLRTPAGRIPWDGVDQERFTPNSWQGDGIDAHIARMQELTRRGL